MKFPPIFYFVPTRARSISITFDDGPTPGVTDKILELLAKCGAKATFFMVGEAVLKHPVLAKEVVDAGHCVGIHSNRHKKGMKFWTVDALVSDFSRSRDSIFAATGVNTSLVRPPFGNICPAIMDACLKLDLIYVGWSVNSKDWLGGPDDDRLSSCSPGSIVVFHDGNRIGTSNVCHTVRLVKSLLDNFRGLASVSVPELILSWDDSQVINHDGMRFLGWNCFGPKTNTVFYWHPEDLLAGLSYGSDHNGKSISVHVPPLSNVDEWSKITTLKDEDSKHVGKIWALRYNEKMNTHVNLGCGTHIIPGWDNFDIASRAENTVRAWEWNMPLPYPDESVEVVLVQHSLQHCKPDDYDRNFAEIARVLKCGGKIVLKEADNRHYVWHRPGSTDSDGYIASSISEPEAVEVLTRNGFAVETDKEIIVKRWGEAINRRSRLLKSHNLFVVEGTKPARSKT